MRGSIRTDQVDRPWQAAGLTRTQWRSLSRHERRAKSTETFGSSAPVEAASSDIRRHAYLRSHGLTDSKSLAHLVIHKLQRKREAWELALMFAWRQILEEQEREKENKKNKLEARPCWIRQDAEISQLLPAQAR